MTVKEKIAQNIKKLRLEMGITQKELASGSGLSYKAIVNYENAYREPKSDAMEKLRDFFHVSEAYLRGETMQRNFDGYAWEDQEIMDAVRESLFPMMENIITIARSETPKNQKHIFNILVEFQSILSTNDISKKEMLIELLEQNIHGINMASKR